jgi:Ala-tRNA(Pro) deacylase
MPVSNQLASILSQHGMTFERLSAPAGGAAATALSAAAPTGTSARSVLIVIDGSLALAMVPVGHEVDLKKVTRGFRARKVELSDEDELYDVCSECMGKAKRLFAHLCGLSVVLDAGLCGESQIMIVSRLPSGGVRAQLIDVLKVLQPRVMDISTAA